MKCKNKTRGNSFPVSTSARWRNHPSLKRRGSSPGPSNLVIETLRGVNWTHVCWIYGKSVAIAEALGFEAPPSTLPYCGKQCKMKSKSKSNVYFMIRHVDLLFHCNLEQGCLNLLHRWQMFVTWGKGRRSVDTIESPDAFTQGQLDKN